MRLHEDWIEIGYKLRANGWHRARLELREKTGAWFNVQRDRFWKTLEWSGFWFSEDKRPIIWQIAKLKAHHHLVWWQWILKNETS